MMIHVLSNILTTAETTVLGLLDLSVASDCADLNYKTKRGVCPSVRPPVLTVAPTPSGIRTHRHSSFLAYVVCHWQKSAGGIYIFVYCVLQSLVCKGQPSAIGLSCTGSPGVCSKPTMFENVYANTAESRQVIAYIRKCKTKNDD